jgi:hypothetical protein
VSSASAAPGQEKAGNVVRGSSATFDAADEESAIEAAAKEFRISDMPRNRLIAQSET